MYIIIILYNNNNIERIIILSRCGGKCRLQAGLEVFGQSGNNSSDLRLKNVQCLRRNRGVLFGGPCLEGSGI